MPVAVRWFANLPLVYWRIVLPFVEANRATKLALARSRGRSPRVVEAALPAARSGPEQGRAQAIFRAVLLGTDADVPEGAAEWLKG